ANLLFSLRGLITLLLSLVIVGAIDRLLQRKLGLTSPLKDLLLSEASCLLIILGVALVGLAPSSPLMVAGVAISALGSSLPVSLRCAIISMSSSPSRQTPTPTPMASLNAAAGMAQSVGILISGPVLAATYSWGLERGGVWVGIPFSTYMYMYIGPELRLKQLESSLYTRARMHDTGSSFDRDMSVT
ncbi:hypothetical protein E4U41_006048, partial [Claviceps citrina]